MEQWAAVLHKNISNKFSKVGIRINHVRINFKFAWIILCRDWGRGLLGTSPSQFTLCFPTEVFICGGYNGEQILSDLWKISLQTYQWSRLPALMPEPAYFHCAAITPVSALYSMLLFKRSDLLIPMQPSFYYSHCGDSCIQIEYVILYIS